MELEVSTSRESTWVWAPDEACVPRILRTLAFADQQGTQVIGRMTDFRVVDVGTGVDALAALGALADAGFAFRWHSRQHPRQQASQVYGVPVRPPHR